MEMTHTEKNDFRPQKSPLIEELESRPLYEALKKTMDVTCALVGLIFVSILFLAVAIAIKIEDSAGPVFYSQLRVGKNGKLFKMYKFRSMVVDADSKLEALLQHNEVSGAMFKMKNDPRITFIGKFIRKTSIDEMPQLFNVLKGDMSLVGPRPPLPREVELYSAYDKQRLLVTPGCTGIWQATSRNNVGFEEMVEMDLEYIRKRSIWLDIKLIFKTIFLLFGSRNAF
ncbi:sugar transferase [Bacillus sp. SJS]|uniref:sugar transferase n=1 Tax=Bacillus sp. SJS TaxID=1423321 RepID=UPI0004DD513C|nr:sugar transferase [Bacillus sp. SJS]KZZ83897.1 multidrug MFS transporter [Bacillus sp. SJS]